MSDSLADFSLKGLLAGKSDYRILYKYQKVTEYALESLRDKYLYFSSFPQLNDPLDPFLTVVAHRSGELTRAISEKGTKVFCATEDRNNPLMWAHYGDSGAGMCIGYAVFVGSPRIFNPVKYVDTFVGSFNALQLMSVKSSQWSWEAEWRACFPGDLQVYPDIAHPVSICLGPRCTTDSMNLIREAMPETVTSFEIIFPAIEDGVPCYVTYDVDQILEHYGEIPSLESLYSAG
ncbi:MAG: DUF2971 domain-containing protein [Pseudomonadota bacterium]